VSRVDFVVAVGADQEQVLQVGANQQFLEKRERGRVQPLQVVEKEDERMPGPRDAWAVTLPDVAHARLDRRGIPTGRARVEPAGDRPLRDAVYDDQYGFAGDRTASLRGGDRRLHLRLDAGYPFLQVYAPAGHPFCCVEPMTAPTNALVTGDHPTVRPGARAAASFTASVRTAR